MTETGKIKCQICGCEISREKTYTLRDTVLCDDCYMEETHPLQTCDPKAVRSAKVLEQSNSQSGEDRLDDLQKALYKFVKDKGKVTLQEICAEFNLSFVRAQNQFAVLRHLELVKGKKEDDKTYIVPF
jgi:predicted transcriptional regulator